MKLFLNELRLYVCNKWISAIPSHRIRLTYYRKVMKFGIGSQSYIFMDCNFDCAKGLTVGSNTTINRNCRIDNRGIISIGNNVSISNDVIILTADHDMEKNMTGRSRPVIIEDYVWIGTRAMIMPGVIVKKGAVIAAGSIVTKNVNENTVVGGIPARVIKERIKPEFNYLAGYRRLFQ